MTRKLHLIFLILFVLLSVVACSSENGAAEIAQENTPPPTNTPQPTDTAVPPTNTPIPTPTATATLIPTPTVEPCDIRTLEDAFASMNLLDSYQTSVAMLADIEPFNGDTVIEFEMAVQFNDGVVEQLWLTMLSEFDASQNLEIIFTEERIYLKQARTSEWETVEGEMATGLLQSFTDSQLIRPEIINNLDITSCQVSYDTVDGVEAKIYSFGEFGLDGIETLSSSFMTANPDDVTGKSVSFTLLPFKDLLIPANMEMVLQIFTFDEVFEMTAVQEVHSIDEPIDIAIPDVTSPTFALEFPLDETAVVILEREDVITFALPGEPELIAAEYRAFFIEGGWLEGDSYEEASQGVVFQATEFSKGYQTLTMLVGESAGSVVVVFGLEGLERFLSIPILPDSDIEEEIAGERLVYLSQLTHDEILEFYTNTLEAEGWTLKNWGTEVYEDYSVTLRLYEKDDLEVRVGISQREDGTLVYIFRE